MLLGTGPSFDKARDYYQDKNLEVVSCNSGIYDEQLWNSGCRIICFGDPVFHFGNSTEAQRFKKEVINRFNNQKFYIVCPIVAFPILVNDWKIDQNFIIGLQPSENNLKIGSNKNLFFTKFKQCFNRIYASNCIFTCAKYLFRRI